MPDTVTSVLMLAMASHGKTNPGASMGLVVPGPRSGTNCTIVARELPLLANADGLPIGVQLVGAPGRDDRLLRTARAMIANLS